MENLYELKNKLVDFAARHCLCVEFEYNPLDDLMKFRFENPKTHTSRTFCATSDIVVEEIYRSMVNTIFNTPDLIDRTEKPEWMEDNINPDPKKIFISTRNPYISARKFLDDIDEMSFYKSPEWRKERELLLNKNIFIKKDKDMKPTIEKVYFNKPYTIVLWSDKTKTMVKAEGEAYDEEKGLAMAICKKFLGTNKSQGNYFDEFKKWLPEEKEGNQIGLPITSVLTVKEFAKISGQRLTTVRKDCAKGLHPGAKKVDGKWMIPY